jgi:hypothetical protein
LFGPSSARCLRAGTCSDSRVASYGVTDIVWPRGPEDSPSSAALRLVGCLDSDWWMAAQARDDQAIDQRAVTAFPW